MVEMTERMISCVIKGPSGKTVKLINWGQVKVFCDDVDEKNK